MVVTDGLTESVVSPEKVANTVNEDDSDCDVAAVRDKNDDELGEGVNDAERLPDGVSDGVNDPVGEMLGEAVNDFMELNDGIPEILAVAVGDNEVESELVPHFDTDAVTHADGEILEHDDSDGDNDGVNVTLPVLVPVEDTLDVGDTEDVTVLFSDDDCSKLIVFVAE